MAVDHLESRISSVTVYSDMAHVTRRARTKLARGAQRFAIAGLPANVDSSRVRVLSSFGRVRSVEWDRLPVPTCDPAEAATIDQQLDQLRTKIERIQGEIKALEVELMLVDRVQPLSINGSAPNLRPDVFLEGLETIRKRRVDTVYALRKKQYELYVVREEFQERAQRKSRTGKTSGEDEEQSCFVVMIDAPADGEAELEVVYAAAWATWRPFYHLRIDPGTKMIECHRFADVWQETGEDWTAVRARISTAEPEEGLRLPSVAPWILRLGKAYEDDVRELYRADELNRFEEDTGASGPADVADDELTRYAEQFEAEGIYAEATCAGVMRLRPGGGRGVGDGSVLPELRASDGFAAGPPGTHARSLFRRPSRAHPDLHLLRSMVTPEQASGGIDFVLDVAGEVSAASGKTRTRLSLGSVSYPARVEYLMRPAVRSHAYGRVIVTNAEDVPLLAGPAAIFVDDAFFGESSIATTPALGKLVLELGAETSIRSARRSKTLVRTAGLIAKEDVHAVEVKIEIENYTSELVELHVEDQIPLARDAKVAVRLAVAEPKPIAFDELTGAVKFKIVLPPASKKEISFVYEIVVPKDFGITQALAH